MQPVDLLCVVENALAALRPEADAKSVRIEPVRFDACTVIGDAARLDQIIANVLGNAVKFTGSGGTIEVELACEGAEAVLSVVDSGEGIAAEFLPHVFESFRQADSTSTRRQGGLGLGLAIARHLVQLHGGTIAAESEGVGRGSRITIRLPIGGPPADERAPPVESASAACLVEAPAYPLARMRLLVVDDDPDTLEMVSILARGAGAEVKAASSAREALQLVREWAPDALLSDISMPGEDGYDLIRRVRALPPAEGGSVVAAALTAMATGADRARALEAGYQAHIPKPIDFPALVATLVGLVRESGASGH
jgi:CheY-like chemotaxis protein